MAFSRASPLGVGLHLITLEIIRVGVVVCNKFPDDYVFSRGELLVKEDNLLSSSLLFRLIQSNCHCSSRIDLGLYGLSDLGHDYLLLSTRSYPHWFQRTYLIIPVPSLVLRNMVIVLVYHSVSIILLVKVLPFHTHVNLFIRLTRQKISILMSSMFLIRNIFATLFVNHKEYLTPMTQFLIDFRFHSINLFSLVAESLWFSRLNNLKSS